MRRWSLSLLLVFAACASDDAGPTGATPRDSGAAIADTGAVNADSGLASALDAATADGGATPDASSPPDAASAPDASSPPDAASAPDAAASPDGGALADAGEMDAGPAPMFQFFTPAWTDGDRVPPQYTCSAPGGFGHDFNPELVWTDPPAGTAAFVMIFDDPDAGEFPHWAFYTADATLRGVPEGVSNTANLPAGITELVAGDRRVGYVPNCPSGRLHAYRWRLWAVNTTNLGLSPRASFSQLERVAEGASVGFLEFTGLSDASP